MSALAIEVNRLRRTFGSFVAVDDVSFKVNKGEIFGYLGANGAGKSTTIRMLCGLLTPTAGIAQVAGCTLGPDSTRLRSRIGYMSQKFSLYLDLPVESNIRFFGGAYGLYGKTLSMRCDEILERMGLTDLRKTTTADLPGGTRQRLALGTALLHRPEIVFLDEPTAGVDPASRRMFWAMIRQLGADGTTVFVTTHYMDEAEYCARIGLMAAGKLVALDTPRALKQQWVPGRVVALQNQDLGRARALLAETPGVLSIEPFGSSVHVRFDEKLLDLARIGQILGGGRQTSDLRVAPAEVSLQDVFFAVVAEGGRS
jgi:ABC-2 type transport system ATP-binding protein